MSSSLRRSTLSLAALALLASPALAADDTPFVDLSLQDAAARAQKQEDLLVLFFHNENIPDSKRMRSQVWTSASVHDWLATHALAIEIPSTDKQLKNRYGVSIYPLTILIDPDGMKILHKIEGFASDSDLIIGLSTAILGSGVQVKPEGEEMSNPMAWLAWGNYLFTNEPTRSVECLDAYLWCLDKGDEHIPGFRERFFEFILQRLAFLRSYTPKAVDALFLRRDRQRAAIIAAIATPREVQEYLRYCFWGRDEINVLDTIVEMRNLGEEHDRIARVLMRAEINRAVGRKMYDDILRLDPNPGEVIGARLKRLKAFDEEGSSKPTEYFELRHAIVLDASCYFEALLVSSRAGDAMALVDSVVEVAPTGRVFHAFMERTNRIRQYGLTEKLGEMGLKVVGTKGKRPIETQLKMVQVLKAQDVRNAEKEAARQAAEEAEGGSDGGQG